MSDQEDSPKAKSQQRRWRLAFTAINFAHVLAALSKKVLDKNTRTLRSLSYVAIDVHDDNPRGDRVPFFNIDQKTLTQMVREKSLKSLNQFGGVKEVAAILETDVQDGIGGKEADLAHRTDVFGSNRYPKPHTKVFLHFVIEALKDTTIIILMACAILSLIFGIKQHGWKDGWYDGGSIVFAVFLLLVVSPVSNFKQSRKFEKLSNESSDIRVEVVMDGWLSLVYIDL